MKVAFSGMILGASMLGANAASLQDGGHIVYTHGHKLSRSDTDGVATLTSTDSTGAPAGAVSCTAVEDRGDARHGAYPTQASAASVTLDTGDHENGANLAFFCKITGLPAGSEIQEDNGIERSGQGVLVIVQGDQECNGHLTASTLSGSWNGERQYKPTITATKTYDCIKKQASPTEQVGTALAVVKTLNAALKNVVGSQTLSQSFHMARTDDKSFSATETVTYDLGADHPHSAYYASGLTCGDGDPCRGKVTLSAGDASFDIASHLSGVWNSDAAVQYFRLVNDAGATNACSDKVYADDFSRSQSEICDMRLHIALGGQSGLMTTFKCPYDDSEPIGTRANVEACIATGAGKNVDNSCSAREGDGQNAYDAIDEFPLTETGGAAGFKLKLQFPDKPKTRKFDLTAKSFTLDAGAQRRPGATRVIYTFSASGGLENAADLTLKIVGGASEDSLVPVSISGGKITAVLPQDATSVTLQGKISTTCDPQPTTLSALVTGVTLSSTEIADADAAPGYFQKADACDRLFKFHTAETGSLTIAENGVFAGGKDATVEFATCDDTDSEKDCLADPTAVSATSANQQQRRAIIEGACEGIAADQVGAFVQIGTGLSSKVICSGPCGTSKHDLVDLKLDWGVTFTVGLSDSENQLSVTEDHEYEGATITADQKVSFLSNIDQCAVDGSNSGGDAETGCDKADFSGISSAQKMVDKLSQCGGYLNQFLTVTDSKGDEYKFCNSKHLSVDIETMTGSSTDAIGVIASSAAGAATTVRAEMGFVGYKQCGESDGYYRLEAHAEIGSLVPLGWTETSPPSSDIQWGSDLQGDRVVFNTECQNICSPDSPLDEEYQLNGNLVQSSACDTGKCAALSIDMKIQVKGSPCAESGNLGRGDVALDLKDCKGNAQAQADSSLCATLTPSDFGDSSLKVLDQELVKTDPTGTEVAVTSPFFTNGASYSGSSASNQDAQLALTVNDAFHTYTLTVFWEQTLSSGRRLLRTTHVFGAGDHKAKSSIFILPASAQIEDAAGSIEAASEDGASQSGDDAPAEEEDSGLSGGAIAGIIAGGVAAVLGIAYAVMQAQKGKDKDERMGGAQRYSAVRRSERFSTMNF